MKRANLSGKAIDRNAGCQPAFWTLICYMRKSDYLEELKASFGGKGHVTAAA